jgi:protease I
VRFLALLFGYGGAYRRAQSSYPWTERPKIQLESEYKEERMERLDGKRIAFLVSNEGVEQAELTSPWAAIEEAGGQPILVATKPGQVQAFEHLDKAKSFSVDEATGSADVQSFDGLVLPGGVVNADQLRTDAKAIALVRRFFELSRPVAVICHGPWSIVEADQVHGRTLTSWPSLQTDIRNAGGTWVDAEVHVCERGSSTLISSRKPDDLPAFNARILEVFARVHAGTTTEAGNGR